MSQYNLSMDEKRRTTWPIKLLKEAGFTGSDGLVAHPDPDHRGRIVVESRDAIKRRVHERAAEGRHRVGYSADAADELLAERRADASLD
ncbi:hypothetical protein BH23ACT9_BH23ACT9_15730 [soil metagenome]